MNTILDNWKQSISFFRPVLLFDLVYVALKIFFKAILNLVIYFWWLILLDMFLFVAFAPAINKMNILLQQDPTYQPHVLVSFVSLISSLVSFALSTTFMLLIRKQNAVPPVTYAIQNIIRCIHLFVFFSLFIFLGLIFLVSCGITRFPQLPPFISFCIKIVELLTIFFWLDFQPRFISMLSAFERAINLFFYRFPFFVVFLLVHAICDIISHHFSYAILGTSEMMSLFDKPHILLGAGYKSMSFVCKALLIGYSMGLLQYFLVSILFVFYDETKREVYSESLFDT